MTETEQYQQVQEVVDKNRLNMYSRRKSSEVMVGGVPLGGQKTRNENSGFF